MSFKNRQDNTSSWVKNNYDLNGKKVDLYAQTFDATLYNCSSYEISSWVLRIDIVRDCFINNAWCGTMEIHQYTGTPKAKTQTLDLRNYKLEDIELEHLHDGNLLIPLVKGDYLIYYPSVKDSEFPIKGNSELTVGMIFYFFDFMDLSNYSIKYSYHKKYTEGIGFYAVIILLMLWSILFTARIVSAISYQRAWKKMELRKSGISYMSDIYENIYIIDLENDEMTPLHSATESERLMIRNAGAREHLLSMLGSDAADNYKSLVRQFVDLNTLDERLDKKSIACEYMSNENGWCQARFFSMDREWGAPLRRTIFTIQFINDEKIEMERIEERISEGDMADALKMDEGNYAFSRLLGDIEASVSGAVGEKDIIFEKEISLQIPEKLYGDHSFCKIQDGEYDGRVRHFLFHDTRKWKEAGVFSES